MLFLMRALSHRAPLAVPRLLAAPLAGAVPPTGMIPTHCGRPAACLSSAIRLRPGGTGVSLQSSPFGQRDQVGCTLNSDQQSLIAACRALDQLPQLHR